MTLQRRLINLLDRPGGRSFLAFLATRYARWRTGLDVEAFYDDAWIRRVDKSYLAESPTFDWNAAQMASWRQGLGDVLDMHRDWWFYRYRPQAGDIVLDVGAGTGEDAIVFSESVGQRGKVLSVEAHPTTFRFLQKTCHYSGLDHNTICIHRALMDKAGIVSIESRTAHKGNTVSLSDGRSLSSHAVTACSLDELCAEQHIQQIDFLKMNIEGAEQFAITGMPHMIQHTRALCIACHDFLGDQNPFYRTKTLVVTFLQANGFEVNLREQHPEPWVRDHVYGVRKA